MSDALTPAPVANEGPRRPDRMGVHLIDGGIDVVVQASQALAVDLVILDPTAPGPDSLERERRLGLLRGPHGLWWAHVPGIEAGAHYGFRVHGDWSPESGLFHNPAKLLLDPYARGIVGELNLAPEIFGHHVADLGTHVGPAELAVRDDRDSAPFVPHGVIVAEGDPDQAVPPVERARWQHSVVYEAHIRGLTLQREDIPEHVRGTYAGVAQPAVIDHLVRLGITAVELLPIQAIATETSILGRGLTNYWGYSTLGYFAPEPRYATEAARQAGPAAVLAEVKGMVAALHAAGIEVLLDVVYNHTCEGGMDGPLLSWRGLDNTGYYLHDGGMPARYADVTGCGNSLDFRRQRVVQLTLDSLRYWVSEVGIDGFRFDLAVTLGRRAGEFEADHPFWVAAASDPVLSGVKLIAEPWDIGPSGWRTGQFAPPVHEWNDRFRDAVRRFWLADAAAQYRGDRGAPHDLRDLATRLSGSADLFRQLNRGPGASINYVTAHDGFTLADLVTYDHKRNGANGEDNRDGSNNNLSWGHGVDGPIDPDSPASDIVPVRRRSIRNVLGTLLVATGTPMITAGDEFGRTQGGNNNAYCQDSELSWVDWAWEGWQSDLLTTTRYLLELRRLHPVLRPARFAHGTVRTGDEIVDLAWYSDQGTGMDADAWHDPYRRVLQMLRSGPAIAGSRTVAGVELADLEAAGTPARDLLLVINGSLNQCDVTLAPSRTGTWELMWDSVWDVPGEITRAALNGSVHPASGDTVTVEPLSLRLYLTAG